MTSIDEIVTELRADVERAFATDVHIIAIGRTKVRALLSALSRSRRMEEALEALESVATSLDIEDFWTATLKARTALSRYRGGK